MGVTRYPRTPWHRGAPPSDLTKLILDRVIVPDRRPRSIPTPPSHIRWYADEVRRAEEIAAEWSRALLEGFTPHDIPDWLEVSESPLKVDDAIALHAVGVVPRDLKSTYGGWGKPTPGNRLLWGNITVEQLILEVRARHQTTAKRGRSVSRSASRGLMRCPI